MKEYLLMSYIPEGRPPRIIALFIDDSAQKVAERIKDPKRVGFRLIPGHYAVVSDDRTDKFMFEVKGDK